MLAGIKKYIFAACVTVIAITSVVVGYNHVTKASALESTNRNFYGSLENISYGFNAKVSRQVESFTEEYIEIVRSEFAAIYKEVLK